MTEQFPQRLRRLRMRERLAANNLAELCGLSGNMVYCYERGTSMPGANALIAMADFFGVSVDYLLCRTDNPNAI